ncbi:MAG: LysM peptidoglycan-binding domain-containing protein [Desulfobacteraceae bacterium]|nr:LysM peptidoglycan-binding domain-containing protein [Desulfobacteraceae bacterium]
MTMRYYVHKGDCLWDISFRYLKDGARFREISDYHNNAIKTLVQFKDFMPIDDPNLIYIGQTLLLPLQPNLPTQPRLPSNNGTGKRHEASRPAAGIDLKVVYDLEEHNNPTHYQVKTPDYTIDAKITGKITIEHLGLNQFKHNFDLIMNKNGVMIEQNLSTFSHKAFKDLTQNVKMIYDPEKSNVVISAPITSMAKIGSTTVTVQAVSPTLLVGQLKPQPITATVEKDRRRYKYTADIEFKAEVTFHPNRGIQNEPIKDRGFSPNISKDKALKPATINNFITAVSLVIMGVLAWQFRTSGVTMNYCLRHPGIGIPTKLFIKDKTFIPDA